MKDNIKEVSKAHTIYKKSDGTRVPGATTVTGLLNKPFLTKWANNLGLQGIDSSKYTDEAAATGTLAHEIVQCHLQNIINQKNFIPMIYPDYDRFSKVNIDLAENSFLSYLEWEKGHDIDPIICEGKMVSETMGFGGTCDCYCMLDGKPTLIDFKTGKSIYEEYFVQVSAYKELLRENGYPVEEVMILRIGRDENEGFEHRSVKDTRDYFSIFTKLLDIYYIKKRIGWN